VVSSGKEKEDGSQFIGGLKVGVFGFNPRRLVSERMSWITNQGRADMSVSILITPRLRIVMGLTA
jgi:hypothetical protein